MPFQVLPQMAWRGQTPMPWPQAPYPHSAPLRRRLHSWQQRLGPPLLESCKQDAICVIGYVHSADELQRCASEDHLPAGTHYV